MNEDEYNDTIIAFMQEVKVITGVRIFKKDEGLDAQIRSIKAFFKSNTRFYKLTRNEIIHAFYLNLQGEYEETYRHYNRELNGEYIGDIINAYLRYKGGIFRRDEQNQLLDTLNKMPRLQLAAPVVTSDDYKRMIQEDYQLLQADQEDMICNIRPKYMLLRKMGLIQFSSKRRWYEWYYDALMRRRAENVIQPGDGPIGIEMKRIKLEMYEKIKATGIIPRDEHCSVMFTMQRLVYLRFLHWMKSKEIADIFKDIQEKYIFCNSCQRRNCFENDRCHYCGNNLHNIKN